MRDTLHIKDINNNYQIIREDTLNDAISNNLASIYGLSINEIRAFLKGWNKTQPGQPTEENITQFFEELE
jgi:hypothetical protein